MTKSERFAYPPRLFAADEAARYLGISIEAFLELGVCSVEVGLSVLWDRISLDLFADRLSFGKPLPIVGDAWGRGQ